MTGGADIIKCHVTVSHVIKYFLFAVDMNGINHTKMCRIVEQSYRSLLSSAVKQSIGSTIGFHNHGEGHYYGLLLVESAYQHFHI